MSTNLPTLATWSRARLLRALAQTEALIADAGDTCPLTTGAWFTATSCYRPAQ